MCRCAVTRIEKEEMLQLLRKDDEQRDAAALCAPSAGAVAGTPSLSGLASVTWACPLVPAPFVVVDSRIPFMLSVTAQTHYWLFDKPASMRPSSPRARLLLWIGLTLLHPLSLRARWLCSLPLSRPLEINVDSAYLPSARTGAIGVLARDSFGAVLGGFARPVPVFSPASSVEAFALCAGLDFAITCEWTSAFVESDAATLVNKIRRPSLDLSLLGGLLSSARSLVAASSSCLHVCFAPWSANTIAHTLASWACKNNDLISYSSVCPELISQLVLDDLSSSF
ncbi:hypothetical protein GQ457_10G010430 [Hibiscus cannabinus]